VNLPVTISLDQELRGRLFAESRSRGYSASQLVGEFVTALLKENLLAAVLDGGRY
jgi:hypothetical protein